VSPSLVRTLVITLLYMSLMRATYFVGTTKHKVMMVQERNAAQFNA